MALMQSANKGSNANFSVKNENDETKTNNSVVSNLDDMEHIIVIGNTGLGKSSLIKLLTKNGEIKTANSADSCTTKTQAYPLTITDKDNNTVNVIHSLIYDTQGTQDTKTISKDLDNDDTAKDIGCKKDCEVLNEIQRGIYKLNGVKVKFIWIVPSMERMQSDLQRQAWFINKFTSKENIIEQKNTNENDDNGYDEKKQDAQESKIWDSVLIIIHKPEPGADLIDECGKGAISASHKYGNFNSDDKWIENKNIIGYCNIDWLPKKRQQTAQLFYQMQISQNNSSLFYYYKSDEIEAMIYHVIHVHIGVIKLMSNLK